MRDSATTDDGAEHPAGKPRPATKLPALWTAALLGGVVGLLGAGTVMYFVYGERLPRVTAAGLEEAERRWEKASVDAYEIEVEVKVRKITTYRVTVRGGSVQAVQVNGRPLTRRHAFATWSVPGMFETIRRDMARSEGKGTGGTTGGKRAQISLRGRFHARYGYPERLVRVESREMGGNPEVSWTVTHFSLPSNEPTE